MTQTETIQPNPRPDGVPEIQKVDWLVLVLNLKSVQQAYRAVRLKHIPDECILRIGGQIRVRVDAVRAWLGGYTVR